MKTEKEYETRFLLNRLPDCEPDEKLHIEQGYLCNVRSQVMRVRRTVPVNSVHSSHQNKSTYELTIKTYNSPTDRDEVNIPINYDMFNHLMKKVDKSVTKYRYIFQFKGFQGPWEVDVFNEGRPDQVIIAEFESQNPCALVLVPEELEQCKARNIDGEYMYTNYNLATIKS